ncbi:TPA: hypothetical protein N0F65_011125 [Lagenidium giganteum]|uniref:Transmembrane protein n=1 Tax=Lagenidium giganteum TaxID=4803 RepID=A0AAV2ZHK0_9STRA|nr:TPA: hypothetical protein N0F65_011125 [Lagenidium giganteum]
MDEQVRNTLPTRVFVHSRGESSRTTELKAPYQLRRPNHDIDQWIPFSWVRCVFSLISLALLLSDVPRSGLGTINFSELFPTVAPDTVVNYGPFQNSIVQLVDANQTGQVVAIVNGTSADAVPQWPYKFDTLSIPIRALAQHLNVTSCPSCVLYEHECPDPSLPPLVAFRMLDGVVNATQQTYFSKSEGGEHRVPLEFFTTSKWIDRLHHVLYEWIGVVYTERHRHHVQYLDATETRRLDLCQTADARRGRGIRARIPSYCSQMVPWKSKHSSDASSSTPQRQYRLWEHVAIRLAELRDANPALEFDLTMLFTHFAYTSKPVNQGVRAPFQAYFSTEQQSLTTWIRGQKCDTASGHCTTVLIDDYRYERMLTEHNPNELFLVTAILRCLAQGYVWLRVLLLWLGCFRARSVERQYKHAGLCSQITIAWWTFFRIPAHVVTYGSWFPVVAYALAHYIDCDLFHVLYYCLWSNSNGDDHFDFYTYFHFMAVQMRNVWVAGAFVLFLSVLQSFLLQPRNIQTVHVHGLLGIRGYVISFTSTLTIFAQFPRQSFRDSRVIDIEILPRMPFGYQPRMPRSSETPSEFGFRYELLILAASFAVLASVAGAWTVLIFIKRVLLCQPHTRMGVMVARSYFVPLSVQSITPISSMAIFWKMGPPHLEMLSSDMLQAIRNARPFRSFRSFMTRRALTLQSMRLSVRRYSSMRVMPMPESGVCATCSYSKIAYWQVSQGCVKHDAIIDVPSRSPRTSSIFRLMNIVAMTDPFVLLQLVYGDHRLYMCRLPELTRRHLSKYQLPMRLEEYLMYVDNSCRQGKTINIVPSSELPWTLLIECG